MTCSKSMRENRNGDCGGGEMVDGKWQPNKEGLGLGKVLDYIGVNYK